MKHLYPLALFVLMLQSCSEYQKVLKDGDVGAKYEMAERYYNEGDFKKANRLLEQITPKYVGKPQGERVMFFFANSYFQTGDYYLAGYQFERFLKSYPSSDKASEAAFLGAKSYYELSPRYSLDQTDTDTALQKLQTFINSYPDSEYFDEANQLAQELTAKKELKQLEIAKQFNKIGEFDFTFLQAAVTALDNFISENPGSPFREEALFYRLEAGCRLAMNSTEFKRYDRLKEAELAYGNLKKYYPETQFAKEADKWLEDVEKEKQVMEEKYPALTK